MVYIFIMLIMQLISTINLITKNLNLPVHLFQLNWYTLLGTYMYSHAVHICTQLKHFERQYFSSWHNIIGVGMGIIYQTKPPLWYKTPQRWFKEGTLSGFRQNIKKVYFDLKSRCKEIKDHNFLPFLQLYDFA